MSWWRALRPGWRRSSLSERPPAPDPGVSIVEWAHAETTLVLEACARERAPATVFLLDGGASYALRFSSYAPEEIGLDLPASRRALHVEPLSPCWATFIHAAEPTAFLSQVRRVEPAGGERPDRIYLRTPTRLARENLRSAARLGALDRAGLRVRLVADDRHPRPAIPIDLSLSGMLVELPQGEQPRLAVHEVVDLELTLGEQSAWLLGVVRRRSGRRVGLHFPEALRGGRVEPPRDLARIVRRLEAAPHPIG